LARATDVLASVGRHSVVVVALLLGGSTDVIEGVSWAAPVVLASVFVLLCFAIAAALLVRRRRDWAVELILEGRESVPLAIVEHERRRLAAPRTRRLLANTFDRTLKDASRPRFYGRGARPLYEPRVVASVAEDLVVIIRPLRTGQASVRGIALAERLLTDGLSPLYGAHAGALREELYRIRDALQH